MGITVGWDSSIGFYEGMGMSVGLVPGYLRGLNAHPVDYAIFDQMVTSWGLGWPWRKASGVGFHLRRHWNVLKASVRSHFRHLIMAPGIRPVGKGKCISNFCLTFLEKQHWTVQQLRGSWILTTLFLSSEETMPQTFLFLPSIEEGMVPKWRVKLMVAPEWDSFRNISPGWPWGQGSSFCKSHVIEIVWEPRVKCLIQFNLSKSLSFSFSSVNGVDFTCPAFLKIEWFFTCVVQYASHWPPVAI